MYNYPEQVKVVEVGPRDGLQNEPMFVATQTKIDFIERLATTGLTVIEATSFVDPQRVPQFADAEQVFAGLNRDPKIVYPVLVPNMHGLERALKVGVTHIAVFTAASETFNQKNIRCSIAESLARFEPIFVKANALGLYVRGYISCVLGCPYEGNVPVEKVCDLARHLHQLGCQEISLGDTIGVGTPLQARTLLTRVAEQVPMEQLAVHFHDTYGQALANILACLEVGVAVVDAAVAGLGGCPFARGATGNVATEDVVYMLHGMGIRTGVDLARLVRIGNDVCTRLERLNQSRVGRAYRC